MTRRPNFKSTDEPVASMNTSVFHISDIFWGAPVAGIIAALFVIIMEVIALIFSLGLSMPYFWCLGLFIGIMAVLYMCRQPPLDFEQKTPKSSDDDIERMI